MYDYQAYRICDLGMIKPYGQTCAHGWATHFSPHLSQNTTQCLSTYLPQGKTMYMEDIGFEGRGAAMLNTELHLFSWSALS